MYRSLWIFILFNILVYGTVASNLPEYELFVPVQSAVSGTSTDALPILSIGYVPSGCTELSMLVSISIWNTGKIIWSKDGIKGGLPYCQGKIEDEQLTNALKALREERIFDDQKLFAFYPGPDNAYCVVNVIDGDKMLCMTSSFDFAKLIDDASDRSRKYYAKWKKITQIIRALIPKEGAEVEYHYSVKRIKYIFQGKQNNP